jgi:hypothetical protein
VDATERRVLDGVSVGDLIGPNVLTSGSSVSLPPALRRGEMLVARKTYPGSTGTQRLDSVSLTDSLRTRASEPGRGPRDGCNGKPPPWWNDGSHKPTKGGANPTLLVGSMDLRKDDAGRAPDARLRALVEGCGPGRWKRMVCATPWNPTLAPLWDYPEC